MLTLPHLWEFASRWYEGRMSPDWRGRTVAEARAILDGLGLTDPFWKI